MLTPLVAHEFEDGESQTNFTAAHANHYDARFVADLGDEIPDFRFYKELRRVHRSERPADLIRPNIKALCRQMNAIDGHFRLEASACGNK